MGWCTSGGGGEEDPQIFILRDTGWLLVGFPRDSRHALEEVRWAEGIDTGPDDYRDSPPLAGATAHLSFPGPLHVRGTIELADGSTLLLDQDLPGVYYRCGDLADVQVTWTGASTE